jgi:hypothetical protein
MKPTELHFPRGKHAYCTGMRGSYSLIVSHDARMAGFHTIAGAFFDTYRCAQDIANAINAHMARKKAKQP